MKKRLLFAFMAMCVAVSGFALTNGEYVYTPQGRFQVTSDLKAYSNFTDLSGWDVVTAAEGKTVNDNFTTDANGPVAGMNCAVSLDATAGEGMCFKFTPTDAGATYVVSYKMKGAATVTTRVKAGSKISTANVVKVEGNTDGVYAGTNDVLLCNTAEELTDDWQTFNYAIVGDGTARTYFISFVGMQTNIYIADLQIAEALQVADLRKRDAAVEKINVYKNAYAWGEDVLAEYGINDALETLNAIGDQSAQSELDDALVTANETLTEFLNSNMDDYLAGNNMNYLGINTGSALAARSNKKYGDWDCVDRGEWGKDKYPDLGHYQQTAKWANNNPDNAMGVTMKKELTAGSYVFGIMAGAAVRENVKQSWDYDDAMKVAYGVASVVKYVDDVATDTIAQVTIDPISCLESDLTPFFVTAKVEEAGTYEFAFKAWCREGYKNLTLGSATFVRNASIWGKNDNKYNQKQLKYEADVREQITTGRTQLDDAAKNIANAEKPWGKAELQACVDTVAPKIAVYEALTQDDIIATYQDYYEKTTSNDNGLMVYEVYQAAVKDIIAANRKFTAVNDTLESMQTAIDAAENVLGQRIYDAATGKDALKAAIAKAQGTQAAMKAAQYSEENADAIEAANAELADAVETFKTTVPASAYTSVVDIDFTNAAEQDPETLLYKIAGAQGSMEFSSYNAEGATDQTSFEKGFWSNGEQLFSDVLRVGNGTGTVIFDSTNGTGSMGTNILKVQFDMYYGNLSGKSAGFYIYNGETEVAGLFISKYSGTEAINTFALDKGLIPAVGSSSAANDAICAESNKTHFEVIFDFGEKSMYCTTDANGKSQTSVKKSFNESAITSFVVKSDYNNSARRSWFDNLKIEQIQAGATEPYVGIENAKAADAKEAPVKVFENGQIIIGGKYNAAGAVVK
ncbi:MAG: hypothetical protein IKN75_05370 [Prevotella sp.]|nr:hypothetical protein [Prevotella sp.]